MLLLTGEGDAKSSQLPANIAGMSHPTQATTLYLSVARLIISKESSSCNPKSNPIFSPSIERTQMLNPWVSVSEVKTACACVGVYLSHC